MAQAITALGGTVANKNGYTSLMNELRSALGAASARNSVASGTSTTAPAPTSPFPNPPPPFTPTPAASGPTPPPPVPVATVPPAPVATVPTVYARPHAPTSQAPIDLVNGVDIAYSGNGRQIDPTWAGMDRTGIKPKYGAIVSRIDPATGKVQVLLAKPKAYFSNTSWTFAKGGQDPNEDALDTANREAMEEVGAKGDIIGHLSGTYGENTKDGLNAYFVMRQTGPIDDAAWKANGEMTEVKWVDIDQAHKDIEETAQDLATANGIKAPNLTNWQRDADVLEQTKAALIPGYAPKVNRRVDVLPSALKDVAGQVRAIALAEADGLIPIGTASTDASTVLGPLVGADRRLLASAFQSTGRLSAQDLINAVNNNDPGHVGPSPPGPPPRPGLVWDATTHRWKRPVAAPAPVPAPIAPPPVPAATGAGPPPIMPAFAATPSAFVPKTSSIDRTDYENLDYHVSEQLNNLGLTAEQALQQGKQYNIHNSLSGKVDYSVGTQEIERTLKNLWAQQTTVPIPAQFAYHGAKRKGNRSLPTQSRPKLTQDEEVAAQKWTSSAYLPWARALRETGKPPAQFAKEDADLQSAFGKAKVFAAPVAVERHLTLDPADLTKFITNAQASMSTGAPVSYAGYQAGSTSPAPSRFHGNVEMRINAVHGLDMQKHTHHPHIKEILLNHLSQFKVTSVHQVGGKWVVNYDQLPPAGAKVAKTKTLKAAAAPVAHTPGVVTPFPKDFWQAKSAQDYLSGKMNITDYDPKTGSTVYTLLNSLLAESGRADKPQVLDKAGIDALITAGWQNQYRGVRSKQYTDQFRDQDKYTDAGSGARVYGQGVYIQTSKNGAKGYGSHVLRIAVPPTAKVVSKRTLSKKQSAAITQLDADAQSKKITWAEHAKRKAILDDDGLFAMLNNYDLINTGVSGYHVLLNRNIVAVQDKDV